MTDLNASAFKWLLLASYEFLLFFVHCMNNELNALSGILGCVALVMAGHRMEQAKE